MFLTYASQLGTPGNLTTNASANTETDAITFAAGARTVGLTSFQMLGKSSALTTISGIVMRFCKFATASTSGTGMTINPVDPGIVSSATTAVATRPTPGFVRTNHHVCGCGAAG